MGGCGLCGTLFAGALATSDFFFSDEDRHRKLFGMIRSGFGDGVIMRCNPAQRLTPLLQRALRISIALCGDNGFNFILDQRR